MHTKPRRLRISIGGFMGPSYEVERVRGELQYRSCERGYANWETHTVPVTDEQWATFRGTLDSLDVWQWEKEYPDPGFCDGTHWELNIAYADRRSRSQGTNNYPGRNPTESGAPEETDVFEEFTKAVQSLLGGRDFR